jgi:hypothetical protein
LPQLAGRFVVDDTFNKTLLYKIAHRRHLATALLWICIAVTSAATQAGTPPIPASASTITAIVVLVR